MKPLLLCILLGFLATPMRADIYMGLEGQHSATDWKDNSVSHAQSLGGGAFRLGMRSTHLGIEVGYEQTASDFDIDEANYYSFCTTCSNLTEIGHFTLRSFTVDGYAYWPLGPNGFFQPFVTAGIALGQAKERVIGSWEKNSENKTGGHVYFNANEVEWRVGLGAEARFLDDLSARFTLRYQPFSFHDRMNGGVMFNFGLLLRLY